MHWQTKNNTLTTTIECASFMDAVEKINAIARLAETAQHHPDINLYDYKKLTIILTTHDAGGVTEADHNLAKQITELVT